MDPLINNTDEQTLATAKERHQRLFKRGMMWLLTGVVVMGLSFSINFILFHSNGDFKTLMYILTSVGAILIVKGLVDIIG